MESSFLSLTSKGQEELVQNRHKLNLKKRSVLLLLRHNRQDSASLSEIIKKGALPAAEAQSIVGELAQEGFIELRKEHAGEVASVGDRSKEKPSEIPAGLSFNEGISLAEARFLLNDFCLDVFKTQAPKHVQTLAECKTVATLLVFVNDLKARVAASHPERLPSLEKVILEIQQTAD